MTDRDATGKKLEGFTQGLRDRVVYIRSEDIKPNTDPTNNEITVRLDEPIVAGPLEVIDCTVTDAVIPFSFYMLSPTLKNNVVGYTYTGHTENIKSVSAITNSTTTATATSTDHGFSNGETITITGASPTAYNGTFTIANVTTNTFDYTMGSDPGSSASGSDIKAHSISSTTSSVNGSITFTPENYSVYSFMADLRTDLSAFLSDNDFMVGDGTANPIIITYSRTTNKLTFGLQTENSSTNTLLPKGFFTFKLASASAERTAALFGMPHDDTTFKFGNDPDAGVNTNVTSPFAINLNTVAQIIMKGSFANRNMVNINGQESEASTILSVLPITVGPFQFMNLSGATNRPVIRLPGKKISVFTLTLQPETGLPLDFSGIGWMTVLQFTIIRRPAMTAPEDYVERLQALGLRSDQRVIPTYLRKSMAETGQMKEENLDTIKARATLKRRRVEDIPPPPPSEEIPEIPVEEPDEGGKRQ